MDPESIYTIYIFSMDSIEPGLVQSELLKVQYSRRKLSPKIRYILENSVSLCCVPPCSFVECTLAESLSGGPEKKSNFTS